MNLSKCRKAVDTYAPPLGRSYRLLRDATNRRRSIRTKYGFSLAGDPSMAKEDWEADEIEAFLELMESHEAVLILGRTSGFTRAWQPAAESPHVPLSLLPGI